MAKPRPRRPCATVAASTAIESSGGCKTAWLDQANAKDDLSLTLPTADRHREVLMVTGPARITLDQTEVTTLAPEYDLLIRLVKTMPGLTVFTSTQHTNGVIVALSDDGV